jgi:DNA-binding transcriptional ArsR family regulator
MTSDPADRADDADADARALASTLRLRILRMCLDEPLTNREIAERLGKNPATVLHHVRTLADRGFLRAEPVRRGARGSREVPYLATKKSWKSPYFEGITRLLVDTFLEELADADPATVRMSRLGVRPYSLFLALHEDAGRLPRPVDGTDDDGRATAPEQEGHAAAGA